MKVRIEIDTKTFVRFWLVVIGFAVAILAIYNARTALIILGVAFFLALALNGPVSRLARVLPGKSRVLSTTISFLAVVLFIGFFIFLVVPPIVQQTMKFVQAAPTMVHDIADKSKGIGEFVERYHIQPQVDKAVASFQNDFGNWVAGIGHGLLSGVSSAFATFAATLLVLVLTFLMLIEGPRWMRLIWGLYKDHSRMREHKRIVSRMYSVVTGYVGGQLTVSGIDALAAGATVFIIGQFIHEVPLNLALPTIAICFVLSLIPMFGATIAGILVSLLLAFNSLPAAIIFAIYFIVYQQIENNVISPRIQSKRIELTPLAVLVAVTIGLYMFGLVGGIISIPIAGCVKVLLEEYVGRNRGDHEPRQGAIAKLARKLTGGSADTSES